jgi:hypothetical protein
MAGPRGPADFFTRCPRSIGGQATAGPADVPGRPLADYSGQLDQALDRQLDQAGRQWRSIEIGTRRTARNRACSTVRIPTEFGQSPLAVH